jgi:hypothetical protein
MVEINLTWQAASFFCASLLLSAIFLGGMINPDLKVGKCSLCLVCPQESGEMFFQNGATFVYHIICFLHFGGMAAGSVGLLFSLIGIAFSDNGDYLKGLFGVALPLVWVLAWVVQLIVLATAHEWRAYDAEAVGDDNRALVPSTVWLWWSIFAFLLVAVTTLVITSSHGILSNTYTRLDKCNA